MNEQAVYAMKLTKVYPLLVAKAERKGRTQQETDAVIRWLTGYDSVGLAAQLERNVDYGTFFREAPRLNPAWQQITGTICGCRIEAIQDPLMRQIRVLDKLIDQLAKGKPLEKLLPE